MAPIKLTAGHLLKQPLPDLLTSGYSTQSNSTHDIYYESTIGDWKRLEMNTRLHTES